MMVSSGAESAIRLAELVGVLGTLTMLVYRLGVWRQEVESRASTVGAELKAYHEASAANFDRLDRRLEAIDHLMTIAAEFRAVAHRRLAMIDRRLERLEKSHGVLQD